MRPIDEIIVHATATPPDWRNGESTASKVAEVRRWHTEERGWRDIGYHYLIDRDGTVAPGRPVEQTGAHVVGHNAGTIGVSLFGGHGAAATDQFVDHFTPAQDAALRALIDRLQTRFPAIRKVTGHNEYAAKACPGFAVAEWLNAPGNWLGSNPSPEPQPAADPVRVARWRLAAIRDAATAALTELPD